MDTWRKEHYYIDTHRRRLPLQVDYGKLAATRLIGKRTPWKHGVGNTVYFPGEGSSIDLITPERALFVCENDVAEVRMERLWYERVHEHDLEIIVDALI